MRVDFYVYDNMIGLLSARGIDDCCLRCKAQAHYTAQRTRQRGAEALDTIGGNSEHQERSDICRSLTLPTSDEDKCSRHIMARLRNLLQDGDQTRDYVSDLILVGNLVEGHNELLIHIIAIQTRYD